MTLNITRLTIYALIGAMEEDLRATIKDHLGADADCFNTELLTRAKTRLDKDMGMAYDDADTSDLVDYFDLGDTYTTINANSPKFPQHIFDAIKRHTKDFEKIVPIRNRVMHIRPLNFNDSSIVFTICEILAKEDLTLWKNISQTLSKLNEDSSFVLSKEIKNFDNSDAQNNNLPLPDFDETGLIGRDIEVKKIKNLIQGSFPVISIVGEGGVGKTALALKADSRINCNTDLMNSATLKL